MASTKPSTTHGGRGIVRFMSELESSLRCPVCHAGAIVVAATAARCEACGQDYPSRGGIPALIPPHSPLFVDVRDAASRPAMAFSTDATRQRDYWESDDAHRPVTHPIVEGFSRQRWQHLAGLLPLDSIHTALDVGAGSGFSTAYAPAHIHVTATDGSWGMIEKNPCPRRVLADAYALPFADRTFDLVYCWELLHHVPEPWQVLREMARVSRRFVYFFEPNPLNAAQAAFALADPEHRWVLRFHRRYVLEQARRAGIRVTHDERCGLIFPNRTPELLYPALRALPFSVPLVGISQLIIGNVSAT